MKCPTCGYNNQEGSSYCNRCGAPMASRQKAETEEISKDSLDTDLSLSPGDAFGTRYKIIEEIDRGGMGRVYKAEDKVLKIEVALKIIHPHNLTNEHALERFKSEILLAREISHENVIRIHDFGEEQGIKFISMQYIDGWSLKEMVRETGPLDIETALDVSRQICEGLGAAHKKGIVHRDLKPQNIMVDKDGTVVIMDFGLARSIEGEGISLPDMVVGTPEYLSPEQAKGEKVDGRSDLYSLGIIMYELVTGKLPFTSETVLGYITKHINQKPASPSVINPVVPNFYSRMILKCLQKDPRRRYQTTKAILHDIAAEEVARGPFFRRLWVRRTFKIAAAVVFVLVLAWGIYREIGQQKIPGPVPSLDNPRSLAVTYFQNNTGDKSLDRWSLSLTDLLITDLAQSRYFRVLPENRLFQILMELGLKREDPVSIDLLRNLADKGNVDQVITGSFTRAGDTFRVGIKILDPATGEYIDSGFAEGRGEESLFKVVDQLTKRVKLRFNIPQRDIRADFDREVALISTDSPEALWSYVEGKHHQNRQQYELAVKAFDRAVDLDPEFAMAYWQLGWTHARLGNWKERKHNFQMTIEHLNRVSVRERYLIEAAIFSEDETTVEKSINSLEKLIQRHPEDCDALERLGSAYQFIERWRDAEIVLSKAIDCGCKTDLIYIFLAYVHLSNGEYHDALKVVNAYDADFPKSIALQPFAERARLGLGQFDLAMDILKKGVDISGDPDVYWLERGDLMLLRGDFDQAETVLKSRLNVDSKDSGQTLQVLDRLLNLEISRGRFSSLKEIIEQIGQICDVPAPIGLAAIQYVRCAYSVFAAGWYDRCINLCEQAIDIHEKSGNTEHTHLRLALYLKGLTLVEKGKIAEFQTVAEKLRESIEQSPHRWQIKFHHHLQARLALYTGDAAAAVDALKKAMALQSHESSFTNGRDMHALLYYDMGKAFKLAGDRDQAIGLYERIGTLTMGRFRFGDIYARSFYQLGRLYQEKGWEGKAIESYEKFLKIWKDADPDLKELRDTRRRLAVLIKGSSL